MGEGGEAHQKRQEGIVKQLLGEPGCAELLIFNHGQYITSNRWCWSIEAPVDDFDCLSRSQNEMFPS